MTVNLDLPIEVQHGLLAQAQESGLSLEAYVAQILRERVRESHNSALARSQLAGQRIRELRKGAKLGGIAIRTLIEEGRE
jgi:hypothetical protein